MAAMLMQTYRHKPTVQKETRHVLQHAAGERRIGAPNSFIGFQYDTPIVHIEADPQHDTALDATMKTVFDPFSGSGAIVACAGRWA